MDISQWRSKYRAYARELISTFGASTEFADSWTTLPLRSLSMLLFSPPSTAANSLLYGLPNKLLDRLKFVQSKAARMVRRVKKHDHITPHLKALLFQYSRSSF
jgi:hypothetical protein